VDHIAIMMPAENRERNANTRVLGIKGKTCRRHSIIS
jgi:hypothetical protein